MPFDDVSWMLECLEHGLFNNFFFEQCFQTCDLILVFTYWLLHTLSQHGHILRYFDDRFSQDMFVGVIAVNPQETKLLLLGTPRGLKACSISSMLSCSL